MATQRCSLSTTGIDLNAVILQRREATCNSCVDVFIVESHCLENYCGTSYDITVRSCALSLEVLVGDGFKMKLHFVVPFKQLLLVVSGLALRTPRDMFRIFTDPRIL